MKALKILKSLFAVRFYTAAQDYVSSNATVIANSGATAALINQVGSTRFNNVVAQMYLPYSDTTSGEINIPIIHCRNTPVGDAVYANLPIGSIAIQAEITSTAITDLQLWIKGGSGASDWRKILASSESTSATAYTAAKSLVNIRGTNSGTGDFRAVYGRIILSGAGGNGDALRGYATTTAAATSCRGAHLTGEVGAAGSVSGCAYGATIQLTTVTGLTLSDGTVAALELVSDLASAVTGMTKASFIRFSELQSNKMPFLFEITTASGGCIGATTGGTPAGTLKIDHNGTPKYIQMYSAAS
jgi:hypothetical protein